MEAGKHMTHSPINGLQPWSSPEVRCFGSVQDLTAGGSAQNYSEAFECRNQQIFFRC